ncbi:MAG: hypothetical protein J6K32_05765 [Clostridia bacterium]|nr:hypothetical protein [Clostridia bacterium]
MRIFGLWRMRKAKKQPPAVSPASPSACRGAAAPQRGAEKAAGPADMERAAGLQRMSDDLHLFLRLPVMGCLRRTEDGYELELDGEAAVLPGAHTLYEAYLALDERWGGDWHGAKEKTAAKWTETAARMTLDAALYLPLWQRMREQIREEATTLLPRYGCAEMPDRRSLKSFTVLGTYICDRIAGTLGERKPYGK